MLFRSDYFNSIDIAALYQLGIITPDQYWEIAEKIESGEQVESLNWDYETLCGHTFYLLPASDRYKPNGDGTFSYVEDKDNIEELLNSAIPLKIPACNSLYLFCKRRIQSSFLYFLSDIRPPRIQKTLLLQKQ